MTMFEKTYFTFFSKFKIQKKNVFFGNDMSKNVENVVKVSE